jgi:hypothetical protein
MEAQDGRERRPEMTERPILFSGPMVRALLDGRKTQTRRIVRDAPNEPGWHCDLRDGKRWFVYEHGAPSFPARVPYVVGDRLYVKETWGCHWATDNQKPSEIDATAWSVRYFADDYTRPATKDGTVADLEQVKRKRPSMFMPRWASRLTLTVTDVRVERLQDISAEDAKAEGLRWEAPTYGVDGLAATWNADPRAAFAGLWNTVNGDDAWDANPWVVALTFTVEATR